MVKQLGQALLATVVVLGTLTACGGGASGGLVAQSPATGAGPATMQIINSSNETIYYVYMSPVSQSTWGPDLLGSRVLQQGQMFTLSNLQPGQWDLRVVDASGNYKEWRNQRLDPGGTYTLQVSSGGWLRD